MREAQAIDFVDRAEIARDAKLNTAGLQLNLLMLGKQGDQFDLHLGVGGLECANRARQDREDGRPCVADREYAALSRCNASRLGFQMVCFRNQAARPWMEVATER